MHIKKTIAWQEFVHDAMFGVENMYGDAKNYTTDVKKLTIKHRRRQKQCQETTEQIDFSWLLIFNYS